MIFEGGGKYEINGSWENLLFVDLYYKKYYRKVFGLKGIDGKIGFIGRNREY